MKGYIYKIVNDCDELIYVGSTTLKPDLRWTLHKSSSKTKNNKLYKHIRLVGVDHFKIECLKEDEFINIRDLRSEEDRYRKQLNATLNSNSCCGKDMIRYKAYQKAYQKMYYQFKKLLLG
jgi:hypothetical protein